MQRAHFDAILRDMSIGNDSTFHLILSLRNGMQHQGKLSFLGDAPDVITLKHDGETTYIALTAIAAMARIQK